MSRVANPRMLPTFSIMSTRPSSVIHLYFHLPRPSISSPSRHFSTALKSHQNHQNPHHPTPTESNGINKLFSSPHTALQSLTPSSTLLCGGFGLSGVPDTLINTLLLPQFSHINSLTAISNNAGTPTSGLGLLLQKGMIKRFMGSYVGENKLLEKMYLDGDVALELIPQGTLAERISAGGRGVPAFFTPAGVGTVVQMGEIPVKYRKGGGGGEVEEWGRRRETRWFGEAAGLGQRREYVMEEAIRADFAFVKAWQADRLGNCRFRYAAQNFNGVMGRNARCTIVEAEEIVEVGAIEPGSVGLPGVYVQGVVKSEVAKGIEKLTLREPPRQTERLENRDGVTPDDKAAAVLGQGETARKRERIVRRAAKEFKNGMYANLGIGMPMLAPSFLDKDVSVTLQSENGILGLGPYPLPGQEDADLINAGKETVTLAPGASTFGSEESFGMIRSGRIDLTILGAMQVSQSGDLANWMLPGKVKGFGGAMDLVSRPDKTRVVVVMEHCDKKGRPKLVKQCEFPLTGRACVSRIITEMAVFDVTEGVLRLVEVADGVELEEVRAKTGAEFVVDDGLRAML